VTTDAVAADAADVVAEAVFEGAAALDAAEVVVTPVRESLF
jgi:hypothetical protein